MIKKTTLAIFMAGLMLVTIFSAMSVNAAVGSYTNVKLINDDSSGNLDGMAESDLDIQLNPFDPNPNPTPTGGNCAIIVCGGGSEIEIKDTAKHARDVFRSKGYLMPDKNDISCVNDGILYRPLKSQVEYAITQWIPNNIGGDQKVVLYFIDHGSLAGFVLGIQTMTPSNLAGWVDSIDGIYSTCTIVIDACFSGIFIPKISKSDRIVMTCTNLNVGYYKPGDELYFSRHFLDAFTKDEDGIPGLDADISPKDGKISYGEAWMAADAYIDTNTWKGWYSIAIQNPQIDDNGDKRGHGTSNVDSLPIGGDGWLALNTHPSTESESDQNGDLYEIIEAVQILE